MRQQYIEICGISDRELENPLKLNCMNLPMRKV